jgi:hypothetical protein
MIDSWSMHADRTPVPRDTHADLCDGTSCTKLNLTWFCDGARTVCRLFLESPPHPQVSATAICAQRQPDNFHPDHRRCWGMTEATRLRILIRSRFVGAGTLSEFAALKPFPNQYEPYCVFGFAIEVRALCTDVDTALRRRCILTARRGA